MVIFNSKLRVKEKVCFITAIIVTAVIAVTVESPAELIGDCSNCHNMHTEEGVPQEPTPEDPLLKTDCVGCHSSNTTDTIIDLGGDRVPIVYNSSGYPLQPLAGGNFFNVAQGGAGLDMYGHNVRGISAADSILPAAPGNAYNCKNSCHISLTLDPNLVNQTYYGTNGCTGCHQFYEHHGVDIPEGSPETAESGWFRFLGGHLPTRYVTGIEDRDWEQNPSIGHNRYSGYDQFYTDTSGQGLALTHSITAFCSGCHVDFHLENGGGFNNLQSPWLRHPTDIALPDWGEYAAYNPVTAYNPEVPVAWINPLVPQRHEAVVMCLSCHRAHGSEYPDMLRWDYDNMLAHNNNAAANTGCFVCHSQKDDL